MTKKFNQIISAALVCILVLLTPGVDGFAATECINNELEEECELTEMEMYEIILDDDEIEPCSSGSASSRLPGSAKCMIKVGTLSKGTIVRYTVSWTIASFPIYVGLYRSGASSVTTTLTTGGSGSFTKTISTAGTYYIYIDNRNSSGVELTVSYSTSTTV